MNKDVVKKKFLRFLKEKKAYNNFKKAFNEQRLIRHTWAENYNRSHFLYVPSHSFNDFISSLRNNRDILNFSFKWSETSEGHEFWESLSDKWKTKN